ncbi:hypothetical protein FEM48_Zijuj01G0016100 [Ziziphus jujuba var. spinosa]|uniref:Pentatricopeptide repeat-containing protein n=1 Tax=Ziziphus jujuba var. spinosa TaxID=714518 RepID=A0A978VYD5_ZIZJJ|nr:hypothetical protein FEM48_Zijuj01G0016100 [Ziziphus jujuba var. spinosa]
MYMKCGHCDDALSVHGSASEQNTISYNALVGGFLENDQPEKGLEVFKLMQRQGLVPDRFTFVEVLGICSNSNNLRTGMVLHCQTIKRTLATTHFVGNVIMTMGKSIFNSMEEIYGIAPDIEHFSCLIDMLGRAGRLTEAEEYMKKFPFGHDPVVLGTLLSACRLHHDVVIGERLARDLLELQPVTSSPYVLLSNLYASDEFWDGAAKARKMLKSSGLKKEPGYSLIEVNGSFKKFTVGEYSHSRIEEIRDTLKSLSCPVCEVSLNDLT